MKNKIKLRFEFEVKTSSLFHWQVSRRETDSRPKSLPFLASSSHRPTVEPRKWLPEERGKLAENGKKVLKKHISHMLVGLEGRNTDLICLHACLVHRQ